jgi:hypothetical protein
LVFDGDYHLQLGEGCCCSSAKPWFIRCFYEFFKNELQAQAATYWVYLSQLAARIMPGEGREVGEEREDVILKVRYYASMALLE